jgi:hypothetical protein
VAGLVRAAVFALYDRPVSSSNSARLMNASADGVAATMTSPPRPVACRIRPVSAALHACTVMASMWARMIFSSSRTEDHYLPYVLVTP